VNLVRIVDTETTGLDPATDAIVEIAKVDWIDGQIGGHRSDLIDPGIPIPSMAKAVHHITEAHIAGAPKIEDVIGEYRADIAAAHNSDFDRKFLGDDFAKHWVCTYKVSLRVWPDFPSHSNQFLRYELGLPDPTEGQPHRALYDASITASLFDELTRHMSVREMVQISREPALLTTLNFGKHRGTKIADTPRDYLDWLLRNSDDESVKFSIRKVLEDA